MKSFFLVLSFSPFSHPGDSWFGSDKVQHFLSSAFVQSATYGSLRSAGAGHSSALIGASVTTAIVGVGKEYRDRNTPSDFSGKDLVWDAAGGATATVLLVRSRR